jgi:hypothetical protein
MVDLAHQALAQCSSTKISLSGYSQGAFAVHNALKNLTVDPKTISSGKFFICFQLISPPFFDTRLCRFVCCVWC